eukprot:20642-Heterococcus_DN1.PRE.3
MALQVHVVVPAPSMRGWARTQHDPQTTWSRRYCALFRNVGGSTPGGQAEVAQTGSDALHFFGSSEMCDRMVGQHMHTSHGCIDLGRVTAVKFAAAVAGIHGMPVIRSRQLLGISTLMPVIMLLRHYSCASSSNGHQCHAA